MSLAIRKSAVSSFLLAGFVLLCSLAANAQLYQVTTPQGDVLIGKHVQSSNSFGLFDLYDPKTGICVVTNDASYVDPNTHLPGKLSNPNVDYIEEIGRIKAGFGKNVVAMYTGPTPKLGVPCSGGTSAATTPGTGAAGELPPCPLGSIANYWNGTTWAPMRTPEMLNGKAGFSARDALKNPFNPNAGDTGIARLKGTDAPITVESSPKFCFFLSQNLSVDYLVGFVDVKGDHREIEFHRSNRGPEKWIPPNRQKAATTKFVGNSAIVTLNEPLPAGQYILGSNVYNLFDFGVK